VSKLGRVLTCGLGLLAAGAVSSAANAQELEEVFVTAQHREQNIQDVPIAVTALSGAM